MSTESSVALHLERHFTVSEIADLWHWSPDKVRDVFRDEPGVLQSQLRLLRSRKRQNVMLSIPESVMRRVHERYEVKAKTH